jgi:hypothetical protein
MMRCEFRTPQLSVDEAPPEKDACKKASIYRHFQGYDRPIHKRISSVQQIDFRRVKFEAKDRFQIFGDTSHTKGRIDRGAGWDDDIFGLCPAA